METPSIIDRTAELRELRALFDRPGPTLALVYGRRRVGKTYLLNHTWPDDQTFYFVAAEGTSTVNRRELIQAVNLRFGLGLDPADYPTWRTVFRLLFELRTPEPLVIVLDEFQYLMGEPEENVTSHLSAVFDVHPDRRRFLLVLCGSAVRTMANLQGGDAPLYGRLTRTITLESFDYFDAAAMMPFTDPRDCVAAYGVFGGTPRYLSALETGRPLAESIATEVLAPGGQVRTQVETLIDQERGLRNQQEYKAILRAIGAGRTLANEIADYAATDAGNATKSMLEKLVDLGYVTATRNFSAKSNEAIRYRLADPALRFHHEIVERYRSELAKFDPAQVWRAHIASRMDTYLGKTFEAIAEQAYYRHSAALGLPMVEHWGRWEGTVSHRRGDAREARSYEIDIVARLSDGRMLTGAVRWGALGLGVHTKHLRDLEALAEAGHGWARDALDPAAPLLYVAGGAIPDQFRERALQDGHEVVVWRLGDLYRGASP